MRKTLKRSVLEQVQAAWEGNSIQTAPNLHKSKNNQVYYNAYSTIQFLTGSPVRIAGWHKSITFDRARELLLNGNILFDIDAIFSSADNDNVGVAIDTIRPGRVGRIKIDNLCWGIVSVSNALHLYANEQLVSTDQPSVYRIIAKSQLKNGKCVCSLIKRSGGGSGGSGGGSGSSITLNYVSGFSVQNGVLIATYGIANVLEAN